MCFSGGGQSAVVCQTEHAAISCCCLYSCLYCEPAFGYAAMSSAIPCAVGCRLPVLLGQSHAHRTQWHHLELGTVIRGSV